MIVRNPITNYYENNPRGLSKFISSCNPSKDDKKIFVNALLAQRNGDKVGAKKIYSKLLKKYPDNSVLKHNILL